ncbi:MAG: cofactor assembly of complex C subunit B [Woronichinia naegeliana WA131]|uniref:Cofactor assembly of complex C subunit B n=1 Tax=Woronichinia naegeliana WA131 TaxID=2824559 RepID=A0A977PUK5_9CYAN|nr:MAG: cofactor assembly of complex C subunit B [Woronichinia naegeliana WA131]
MQYFVIFRDNNKICLPIAPSLITIFVNISVLTSTLILTLLSLIGLIFFIRASVKERSSLLQCLVAASDSDRLSQLQNYFTQRAYQIIQVNAEQQQVILEGYVRPSYFLAIFLSTMAALGLLCFALVLNMLLPNLGNSAIAIIVLFPLAGIFYWQKAGRLEQISLSVHPLPTEKQAENRLENHLLSIRGHRDELTQLKQAFPWSWLGDTHS